MPNQSRLLNHIFQGLADPTRRAVLERLTDGPARVTELARPFKMALPSFSQHLGVLESCGLVTSRKVGRIRTYELSPKQLVLAETWLDKQRQKWEGRLDQLDNYLIALKDPKE